PKTCTSIVEPCSSCLLTSIRRPRKINTILAPHGFKWERGKIEQDGVARDKEQGEDGEKTLKTPTKSAKKAIKTPKSKGHKTPKSNKKRKIDEEEEKEEAEKDDADLIEGEEDTAIEPVVKDKDAAMGEEGDAEDA